MSFEERVVQVEASSPADGGSGPFADRFLTEEDGPPFFDARTGRALASLDDVRLPIGYMWSGNWKIALDQPGADAQGWVLDGRRLRRRWWKRKREMLTSAAMAQKSSSSSGIGPHNVGGGSGNNGKGINGSAGDASSLLHQATTTIQALNDARQRLSGTSTLEAATQCAEEGRQLITEMRRVLALIEKDTKLVAARIKLSGDVNRESERFEQQVLTTLSRFSKVPRRGQGGSSSMMHATNNNGQVFESSRSSYEFGQQQQQQMVQQQDDGMKLAEVISEITLNEEMIEQRAVELKEINRKATTINSMMQELGEMVKTQGETVKVLVTSTAKARDDVASGLKEVHKADGLQNDGGNGCAVS